MYINKQTTAAGQPPVLYWIVEDVFKCHLHINKTFNRVWIESSLNCCLFVYIHIVCLFFTYLISIISWSLKLEQITPPHWLCHAYYKVSNIFYQIVEDVFKCRLHID